MDGVILDVTEWWVIPTIGDEWEVDLTRPGVRTGIPRVAVDPASWFVFEDEPEIAVVKRVDMRPNTDLDDFFATPLPPPVLVVEGNMRKNELLDAFFG